MQPTKFISTYRLFITESNCIYENKEYNKGIRFRKGWMGMRKLLNPYTPGAGVPPKYLAGREDTIREAEEALFYILNSRNL